jgi:HK97 gp10 family phage protein
MATRIKTDEVKRTFDRLAGPEMVKGIGRALYVAADTIKVEAQISITTGAVSGKFHVPSSPGQPPRNDTALLANNIEAVLVAPLKAEVSSRAPYAAALEYGTSKMAERPYMRPAVAKTKAEVSRLLNVAVGDVVRGGRARSLSTASKLNAFRRQRPGGVKGGNDNDR